MAKASKVSGEKYRRIFSEYDPVFVGAVSSAALSCNLNFSLKKNHVEVMCATIGLARACADK